MILDRAFRLGPALDLPSLKKMSDMSKEAKED
jgi:hypothetical protein